LTFYLLCTEDGLTQLKSRNNKMQSATFNILFYKYNKVWWQGSAKTVQLAEVRREPGTLKEIIHVLWSLEGKEVAAVAWGITPTAVSSQKYTAKRNMLPNPIGAYTPVKSKKDDGCGCS
jgi:hypothetical protein